MEFAPHHDPHPAQNIDLEIKSQGSTRPLVCSRKPVSELDTTFPGRPPMGRRCVWAHQIANVRLSTRAVDSPLVLRPDILIAMNEPSLQAAHAPFEAVDG